MIIWRLHHKERTKSTNLDARVGEPGDVYTADYQSAGRGRLDHKWLSPPGVNLMMSAVLSVEGISADRVATLPLVMGLAVVRGISRLAPEHAFRLKWPNDVLLDGRKLAGLLCERVGDCVIVGIGVNVAQQTFPPEIADRAISLDVITGSKTSVNDVREVILSEIAALYECWREKGFEAILPEIEAIDFLKGRFVSIRQTDEDSTPVSGVCHGIAADGSLTVGDISIYAGEAHVIPLPTPPPTPNTYTYT